MNKKLVIDLENNEMILFSDFKNDGTCTQDITTEISTETLEYLCYMQEKYNRLLKDYKRIYNDNAYTLHLEVKISRIKEILNRPQFEYDNLPTNIENDIEEMKKILDIPIS